MLFCEEGSCGNCANRKCLEEMNASYLAEKAVQLMEQRKYPLIPTLWMIFEDSTFAFRSGDKHRSRRIYGK